MRLFEYVDIESSFKRTYQEYLKIPIVSLDDFKESFDDTLEEVPLEPNLIPPAPETLTWSLEDSYGIWGELTQKYPFVDKNHFENFLGMFSWEIFQNMEFKDNKSSIEINELYYGEENPLLTIEVYNAEDIRPMLLWVATNGLLPNHFKFVNRKEEATSASS